MKLAVNHQICAKCFAKDVKLGVDVRALMLKAVNTHTYKQTATYSGNSKDNISEAMMTTISEFHHGFTINEFWWS